MKSPAGLGGAFVVFVNSVISVAVLLELVSLTPEQIAGINLVVVNAVALAAAVWTYMRSTPVDSPTLPAGTQVTVVQPGDTPNTTTTV